MSEALLSHEEHLEFTQTLTHQMIKELIPTGEDGKVVPNSEEDRDLLVKLLTLNSKNALGALKVKSNDKRGEAEQIVALALQDLAQKLPTNGYRVDPIEGEVVREIPKIPADLVLEVDTVPGELDTTTTSLNYKDFSRNFAKDTTIRPSDEQDEK